MRTPLPLDSGRAAPRPELTSVRPTRPSPSTPVLKALSDAESEVSFRSAEAGEDEIEFRVMPSRKASRAWPSDVGDAVAAA